MFRQTVSWYRVSLKANMQNIVEFGGESKLVEIKNCGIEVLTLKKTLFL